MIGSIVNTVISGDYHVNKKWVVYHLNKESIMKLKAENMKFGYLISIGSGLLGVSSVSSQLIIDPCGPRVGFVAPYS